MEVTRYREDLFSIARKIFAVDSPSGYTRNAIDLLRSMAEDLGYPFETTRKGCGIITVEGRDNSKTVAMSAHVDTLGAMVRSITGDGQLMFTPVGGPILPTLDGEYCKIHTRDGREYTGTILSLSPSVHVFPDSTDRARDTENMAVRIDETVRSEEDVKALGIQPGDYIFFDPKTVVTPSGFLKSRFIDDKGSAACLMTLLKIMKEENLTPAYRTKFFFSVYEEVGHGASYLPADITELVAVDMGCIGLDLSCNEYQVSICAKDSGGPYSYAVVGKLIDAAKREGADYAVDVYPYYGSDVEATLRAGYDIRHGLIGSGVYASHGYERSHMDGVLNTLKTIKGYLNV